MPESMDELRLVYFYQALFYLGCFESPMLKTIPSHPASATPPKSISLSILHPDQYSKHITKLAYMQSIPKSLLC